MSSPADTSSQALTATQIASFKLLRHPSYLADLTPSDFCVCFTTQKKFMKRWKFTDDNDVICTTCGSLEDQDQEFFYNGVRALENRWTKCISVEGTMFKSDKISCSYSVVNCIRLRTFWTPLVRYADVTYWLLPVLAYLSDVIHEYHPTCTLRSADKLLVVPRMLLTLSAKVFCAGAPSVWNSLSYNCRSAELLSTFKRLLEHLLYGNGLSFAVGSVTWHLAYKEPAPAMQNIIGNPL